ncbi:MAG: GNAT family N-acetyltransferase [Oscillospiraceae bacterium]|jgi:GNAT superfamily N-acetyltransferase|nr:GNAT family N-acetyltransferase [Oscillospiraceae bacterium]
MIRVLTAGDEVQITELWQEAFGDGAEEIHAFLAAMTGETVGLGLFADGALQSQLFILPGELTCGAEVLPAGYVCAVATRRAGQGKNYASRLLESAREYGAKRSLAGLVLYPASESLVGFYAKRGYAPAFCATHFFAPPAPAFVWTENLRPLLRTMCDGFAEEGVGLDSSHLTQPGMLLPLNAQGKAWLEANGGKAQLAHPLD